MPPLDPSSLGPPPSRPPHKGGRPKGPPPPPPPPEPHVEPPPPVRPPELETGAAGPTASDLLEYQRLVREQLTRQIEALRLYEPIPLQAEFHRSKAKVRLLRGSNRSGKTLATAVELVRAVTGRDPFGKYPTRDGRCYVVGKDEKHLGEVIYRKLFRAEAFRMIRDQGTKAWRAFRPWDPADLARSAESKFAPPLIPPRYVKQFVWKHKGANVPEKVVLTTGWEIDFFSSLGKPARGSDLDFVWLDEEIVEGEWYPEMLSRLLDRKGRLIWGATPQAGTDRLFELHQRCEAEQEEWERQRFHPDLEPSAREFVVLLADNPHIQASEKRELEKGLTETEAASRVYGEFSVEGSKVYPEFHPRVHGRDYFDIPPDWTRFAVVDPGRQVCAVLFAAVPGPDDVFPVGELDDGGQVLQRVGADPHLFLFDELYIRNCSAETFGEAMAHRCNGQEWEAFIIDAHGSRLHDTGSGKTIVDQYEAALRSRGVRSRLTESGFVWGSDDVKGRTEQVRSLLRVRPCGWPTLHVVALKDRLPNLKYEIERYRYKRTGTTITDVPEDRGRVHLMACLGYLAAYGPRYVEPSGGRRKLSGALDVFRKKQMRKAKAGGAGTRNFGPPRPKA